MTAVNEPLAVQPKPYHHVTAKSFDNSHAFTDRATCFYRLAYFPVRQPIKDLLDQRHALFNFSDADPNTCIDVAGVEHRHLKFKLTIRRVAGTTSGIKRAA